MKEITRFERRSLYGHDEVVTVYRCNGYYHVYKYRGPMSHGFFNIFDGDDYTQLDKALEADELYTFALLIEERIRDTESTVLKMCGE